MSAFLCAVPLMAPVAFEQRAAAAVLLDQWRSAVISHAMGQPDEPARLVADWSVDNLQTASDVIARGSVDNSMLKRGAVLHFDIVRLLPAKAVGPLFRTRAGDTSIRVLDGTWRGVGAAPTHLEFARLLLDRVSPAPAGDDTVRLWYTTTAAYLARDLNHAESRRHLEHARRIFPRDREILLASGCLYETFAGPRVQSVVRAALAAKRPVDVEPENDNLRTAERYFREALDSDPKMTEARLRLGRVLGLLGKHNDAAKELRRAVSTSRNEELTYFALLFLGREAEILGNLNEANKHFQQAASVFPNAQSPYLGLGRLAAHSGDGRGARSIAESVFALPADIEKRHDPWWHYDRGTGREVDALLGALFEAVSRQAR